MVVGRPTFALASLAVLLGSSPRLPRKPSDLFEPVVRAIASKHCGLCYVSVNGKPPTDAVARLLSGVPNVQPFPTSGVPVDERGRANVIDLFKARLTSPDRGEVSAGVSTDMGFGLIASESCTYHLVHGSDGWQVRAEETICTVI